MGTNEQQPTHFAPIHVESKSITWFACSKSFYHHHFTGSLKTARKPKKQQQQIIPTNL
jgi:hypothetical protein